ncbi:hypothetical protein LTR93_011706 [Exophiala xenobiotica]|nr:hypothetical protein LTR93_011706 [Exophiala xenobiotica]
MGADVVVTYSSRAEGGEKNAQDLRESATLGTINNVIKLVQDVIKEFGKIDVFIANAGRPADSGILDGSKQKWDDVIATSLNDTAYCAKAVGQHFKERGTGSFIITESMPGHIANYPQEQTS